MNYIPGFSNYLETSVPQYGAEPIMDAPRQAEVMPMTQEAVAPYDLSGLNFGSNFGGGAMGGQYAVDPNIQYIGAPLSNKGNPTSQTGGNVFAVKADQPVRLVDHRTNQVIFEGTGYDAARKAAELGQGLTDQYGRKANYSIQTADPTGNFSTVAYEKKNKSTLGTIADVAGTALPIAVSLIPGLQFAGPVLSAALAGGAGAALKGDNILKGAAMGGLSAAGGQVLGSALGAGGALGTNLAPKLATAVGTGLGSTAGGLVTGQSLKNSLLGGVASGALSYVAPDIQRELGINPKSGSIFRGGDAAASTGADSSAVYGGPNAEIVVNAPAFSTPNINLGGFKAPVVNGIDQVTGEIVAEAPRVQQPTGGLTLPSNPVVNGIDQVTGEIVATAPKVVEPTPVSVPVTGALPTDIVVNALGKEKGLPEGSVLADLGIPQVPTPDPALTKKELGVEDYLRIASLLAGLIPGGKGGSGQTGTYTRGGLNPIFSAKLPTANIPGGVGDASNLGVRPTGEQDWLTYAERPEQSFYNYVPQPTGMAEGGALPAKHGGASRRTEFAVNGPGTGRSDEIPAVLSDGEYVIDAETVALLGDGSSKAGAKKLDDLRVKVRKHKGKKLAKGRFSANAKKPEAYLSGGRI